MVNRDRMLFCKRPTFSNNTTYLSFSISFSLSLYYLKLFLSLVLSLSPGSWKTSTNTATQIGKTKLTYPRRLNTFGRDTQEERSVQHQSLSKRCRCRFIFNLRFETCTQEEGGAFSAERLRSVVYLVCIHSAQQPPRYQRNRVQY